MQRLVRVYARALERFAEPRQAVGPLIGTPKTLARDDVGVVGGEIARHKERIAHVGLGDVRHDRGAQSVAHRRQIADIVLVELDAELVGQRSSVKAGDLTVDLVYQRGGYAVINDRVEADLAQRVAQLGRGAIERPGLSREIGPRSMTGMTLASGMFQLAPASFEARIAPLNAVSDGKSPEPEPEGDRRRPHASRAVCDRQRPLCPRAENGS